MEVCGAHTDHDSRSLNAFCCVRQPKFISSCFLLFWRFRSVLLRSDHTHGVLLPMAERLAESARCQCQWTSSQMHVQVTSIVASKVSHSISTLCLLSSA